MRTIVNKMTHQMAEPRLQRMVALLALAVILLSTGCTPHGTKTLSTHPAAPTAVGLFREVSQEAGIRFPLGHGGKSPLTILETLGHGCAMADFDGDGWLDLLLVGPNKVALYRNNRNGTFTDITAGSGLRQQGFWQGIAIGDYDNDGRTDLYISGYHCCALYHNEGGGRFRDVTQQAGLSETQWGSGACFLDVDNDGYLDLYVCHYVHFMPESVRYCLQGGLLSTCGPTNYDPEKGTLYHNNGNGTFSDETAKRGLADSHGNALGIAIADYDDDGWIDFAVANDQLPGDLYHNKGHGYFENAGLYSGTAYDVGGQAHAGMGEDWADVGADGKLALIVTTYQHQPRSLYEQTAKGMFTDACYTAGIGNETMNYVGFGVKFLDYDNDGLPDIVLANGHAVDNIARTDRTTTYPQIPQLFHNIGGGRYEETTAQGGPAFRQPIVGRGLAIGDYDNDGRMDILMVDIEGHPLLLHNECANANHWLTLRLRGTRSNRDGIGAALTITANGRTWKQVVTTGGSFLSASDVRAHIGLGAARQADRIEIRWPSGQKTQLRNVAGDRFSTVDEERGLMDGAIRSANNL
jgi:hypothetical protein